jgi:hypothetical protein
MPKPIINNKINYQNIYGLTAKFNGYLNQGVKAGDSPTFANLLLTGDGTIRGNLYVEGNTTILNTNVIEFEDNIVLLNRLETGSGVTLNQSGLEIERGSLENYRMVYNETDSTFQIGLISNLQSVATRENMPLQNGIMIWNDITKRLDSRDTISIDLLLNSTTNSTSTSTGTLVISGGIGIQEDIWTNGKLYLCGTSVIYTDTITDSLMISSTSDINITPSTRLIIPYDKPVVFGQDTESIVADSTTKNISITASGHIDFNLDVGKRIRIPNQIPITFSSHTEQIYTDNSNNMIIGGSQDIHLVPGPNKKVVIPVDIGLSFSNNNQQISANLNNDLSILAGNNIFLTPGPTLDVRIPTDNGIKFGNSGNQRIVSNSSDELSILSSSDIYLTATDNINIPNNVFLTFGTSYIRASDDELFINATSKINMEKDVFITTTTNSENATTGSIVVSGGLGISKTIYAESNIIVNSDESNSLLIRKGDGSQNVFLVGSNDDGRVEIVAGNGNVNNPSLAITTTSYTDAKSLIELRSQYDNTNGYMIGRGNSTLNSGRSFTINIPTYNDYSFTGNLPRFSITTDDCTTELFSIETDTGNIISKGAFQLTNTTGALNPTTAGFVVSGGLGVVENIITDGDYTSYTNSETAFVLKNRSDRSILNVDTQFNIITANASLVINDTTGNALDLNSSFIVNSATNTILNSMVNLYTDTTDSTDLNNAAVVISGGVSIGKTLRVGDISYFNTLDMNNTRIRNVRDPVSLQDVATKAYVDLASLKGLYIKQSVQTATLEPGNLSTDFSMGGILDGYTLQADDRILIKNQDNAIENGIYIVNITGPPSRSLDLMPGDNAAGVFTFIKFGDMQASTGWVCNSSQDNDIVNTNELTFVQFSGLGQVIAGLGLSKDFNELNVKVDDTSIEIVYDELRIKNTFAGTGLTGGSGVALQTLSDQSHVTKLGTIDTGTWQSDTVELFYGGTGRNYFTQGSILFGNDINAINTDNKLHYDSANCRLGLGTNQPVKNVHVSSIDNVSILLDADSHGISSLSKPEMIFSYRGDIKSYIGLTRTSNEYASNIYADSLVISHDKMDTTSIIQFATQRQNRMTILPNGNIGINTSNPTSKLEINGTLSTTNINSFKSTVDSINVSNGAVVISGGIGIRKGGNIGGKLRVYDNTPSTSLNTAAVIVQGGLSIQGNQNAVNVGNGGGLTVAGGASVGGDLYVGGSINGSGSSSSTYAYLTLTATDESVNFSTGSLVTFGGITIQGTTNASSLTDGGTILTEGGASIGADVYIGGNTNLYGYTYYYASDNIITFFDENVNKRFSIDRDYFTSSFSLSRYNEFGIFVEKTFDIDNSIGSIFFANTTPSFSQTQASFILSGGISINETSIATSLTNGGGLTLAGGASIKQNIIVGGDIVCFSTTDSIDTSTGALVVSGGVGILGDLNMYGKMTVDKSFTLNDKFNYNGGGLFDVIVNDTANPVWHYFGKVTEFCEIDFYNKDYGLKVAVKIEGLVCKVYHNYYNGSSGSGEVVNKLDVFVYEFDGEFYLFTKTPAFSTINVNVRIGNRFIVIFEGDSSEPDGTVSAYENTWIESYNTSSVSNLSYKFGDVTIQGLNFNVADNFPVIGYNNSNATEPRNLGLAFQRYQSSNDTGTGELVTDQYIFYDSIPNQSSANSLQIKFSNLVTVSNLVGWWIKIGSGSNINQVRKIIAYNDAQKVATLNAEWTAQNPVNGDTVYFYNGQYLSFYFDDSKKSFELVYNTRDNETRAVTSYDYVNLNAKGVYLSDTTSSSNSTTGSIRTLGGIGISNTDDSSSCTQGGTLTTLGGASVRKRLYVGDNLAIGQSSFTPLGSIHVKQDTSSIRLENMNDSNSFIDFSETGASERFGILSDTLNNQLSITVSRFNETPDNSLKALTTNLDGYIGINTTSNINSPLTIRSSKFISIDANDGYLGLIGGIYDSTLGGRILLYGSDAAASSRGNVSLMSGTSGSVKIFTNEDKERVCIDRSGTVAILTTTSTRSITSGALVVSGGVAVSGTENSSSLSAGGSLTVAGGASIMKDIFIGGSLFITGNLNAGGSSTSPEITFTNNINCTYTGYDNSRLLIVSQEATFSFVVWVTPTVASANCQIEFNLPERKNNLANRSEYIASCSGYTDDDEVIPLFNCISVGVKNQKRGLVKFQSVSTGLHYFNLICRYTMDNI